MMTDLPNLGTYTLYANAITISMCLIILLCLFVAARRAGNEHRRDPILGATWLVIGLIFNSTVTVFGILKQIGVTLW